MCYFIFLSSLNIDVFLQLFPLALELFLLVIQLRERSRGGLLLPVQRIQGLTFIHC